nr:neuropeptide SIFamide receptor [Bactrocera oleae]XP_036218953.1 neuropeptide SIFamide receptor [Bactrocera oleae]
MGSSSSNNNSRIAEAEAVGDCIFSSGEGSSQTNRKNKDYNNNNNNNACSNCLPAQGAKFIQTNSVDKATIVVVAHNSEHKQPRERDRQRRNKLERKINENKATIINSAPQQQQQQQPKREQQHRTAAVNANSSCCHINFDILISKISTNTIALDVLLRAHTASVCNIVEMVTTWRVRNSNRRRSGISKRASNSLSNNNSNNYAPSISNTSPMIGSNNSYDNNNNISTTNNNNSNFGSQTGRAIMSVATTIASTSATMAIANIPSNLLPPTGSVGGFDNNNTNINWSVDGVSWPTLNQSATDKVDLIEMDLANETFSSAYPALRRYHGDYDVSYIARINPFWLQFEPPSTRTYYIMAIIYIIISSIGCLGNSLVIFMFVRCKSLRTPANTLVINLAVSDLLMLMKCPIAIFNNFKQGPALGDVGCRIYGFVGGLSGTASIGTLTAIALDRYNVVVHPLDPLRKTAKVRSAYIITIIWIYSFAFSIVPALDIGLSVYVPEGFLTTCSFDYLDKGLGPRIFMFSFFVAAWCVPFGIICFSYFYILKVVFAANRIQSSKDKNKTEQKLALIVVGIIGLWFLAWTPYSIVAMMGVFGKQKYLTPLGSMIPALFCKTAACIDPYFYAATHPRFRMEFRRLWLGRGNLRRTSTTRSSYLTRSSTRRLRVISDVDVRNRCIENAKKQNNLQALQEVTEENDEDYDFSIPGNFSDGIEQSRF